MTFSLSFKTDRRDAVEGEGVLVEDSRTVELQHPWHPRGDGDDIENEWFNLNLTCRQKRLP